MRYVAEDVDGAEASSVTGTPSVFVNGRRNEGAVREENSDEVARG